MLQGGLNRTPHMHAAAAWSDGPWKRRGKQANIVAFLPVGNEYAACSHARFLLE